MFPAISSSRIVATIVSLLTIAALLLTAFPWQPAYAAPGINDQIPFEGSLKDGAGAAVADGNYDIVFNLYDAATGGTNLWTGTHTAGNGNAVGVTDGIFRVLLGSGTGNSLAGVDFNDDTIFLGVAVEGDPEMTPRYQLGAAAYAFNSDTLDGYDATDFISTTTNQTVNFGNGIGIASSTPGATANTLYNLDGTLYWNGAEVGGAINTLNDIGNVSAAQVTGSLLYWNGSAWDDIATSSLGIVETLTTVATTSGSFTYTDENGDATVVLGSDLETLTTLATTSTDLVYTDEDGIATTISFADFNVLTQLLDAASTTGQIQYVDEEGNTTSIDLTELPDLTVTGDVAIGGELGVTGTTTSGVLVISGDSTLNGGLSVAGNSNLTGDLGVTGTTTLATTTATQLSLSDSLVLASTTPATTTDALYNNNGTLFWNGSAVGGDIVTNYIDSSVASTTETLPASTASGLVRFYTNDDVTNTATLAVQSGETLNGVTDGTFLFSNYADGTQFRADEVTGGWVVNVVGASTQTDLHYVGLSMDTTLGQSLPLVGTSVGAGYEVADFSDVNVEIDIDNAGLVDVPNNKITISQDGLYNISFGFTYSGATTGYPVIWVNGVEAQHGRPSGGGSAFYTSFIEATLQLTAGDEIEAGQHDAGTHTEIRGFGLSVHQLPTTESVLAGMVTPEALSRIQVTTDSTSMVADGPGFRPVSTVTEYLKGNSIVSTDNGKFTVKANKEYRLSGKLYGNGFNTWVGYWYNFTDGVEIGPRLQANATAGADRGSYSVLFSSPATDVEIGFVLTSQIALLSSPTGGKSMLMVEELPSSTVVGIDANDFTGTAGSVVFSDGTSVVEDNDNFYFDDATNRLTIGASSTLSETALNVMGGITLASTTVATTTDALYNQGGNLYWNGAQVGLNNAYVAWASGEDYIVDQLVYLPSGALGRNTSERTSEGSFNATEAAFWSVIEQDEPYPAWAASTVYAAGQKVNEAGFVYTKNVAGQSGGTNFFVEASADWTLVVEESEIDGFTDQLLGQHGSAEVGTGYRYPLGSQQLYAARQPWVLTDIGGTVAEHELDLPGPATFANGDTHQFRLRVVDPAFGNQTIAVSYVDDSNSAVEYFNIGDGSLVAGGANSGNVTASAAMTPITVGGAAMYDLDIILTWTGLSGNNQKLVIAPVHNNDGTATAAGAQTGTLTVASIASGALTDFVGGGQLAKATLVASSTLTGNTSYDTDTAAGELVVTLPTPASDGDRVEIIDVTGNFSQNGVLVLPGAGDTVQGGTATTTLANAYSINTFHYDADTSSWTLKGDIGESTALHYVSMRMTDGVSESQDRLSFGVTNANFVWDTFFDPNSLINTANDTLVIQQAGTYKIEFSAVMNPDDDSSEDIEVFLNGTAIAVTQSDSSGSAETTFVEVNLIRELVAGDALSFEHEDLSATNDWVEAQITLQQLPTAIAYAADSLIATDLHRTYIERRGADRNTAVFTASTDSTQDWDTLGDPMEYTSANANDTVGLTVGTDTITVNKNGIYEIITSATFESGFSDGYILQITDGTTVLAAQSAVNGTAAEETPITTVYKGSFLAGDTIDVRAQSSTGAVDINAFNISVEELPTQSAVRANDLAVNLTGVEDGSFLVWDADNGEAVAFSNGATTLHYTSLTSGVDSGRSNLEKVILAPGNISSSLGITLDDANDELEIAQDGRYQIVASFDFKPNGVNDTNGSVLLRNDTSTIASGEFSVADNSTDDNTDSVTLSYIGDLTAGNQIDFQLQVGSGAVTLDSFNITVNQLPSAVITAQAQAAEYMLAKRTTTSQTGFGSGVDTLFNDVAQSSGSSISLNTTTGEFTLAAGKTYRLVADLHVDSFTDTSTGFATLGWVDSSNVALPANVFGVVRPLTFTNPDSISEVTAIITPTVDTVVKLRGTAGAGTMTVAADHSYAYIEVIADGTFVQELGGATDSTAGTAGFLSGAAAGEQGSLLLGDGNWSATSTLFINASGTMALGAHEEITGGNSSNIADNSLILGNGALCVDGGGLNCDDSARAAGTIYADASSLAGVDLAENYPSNDSTLLPGELVVIDSAAPSHIKRSENADETLLGIISTKPGILLGGYGDKEFEGAHRAAVALAGRVPVLFSAENGPVEPGDKLIASVSKSGYAMAACGDVFCGEARAVAVALESFDEDMSGDTALVAAELEEEVEEIAEAIEAIEANTDQLEAAADAVSEEIQEAVAEGDLAEMSELSAVAEDVSEDLTEAIAIEEEAHELEETVAELTQEITDATGEGRLMAFVEISRVEGEVEVSAGFLAFVADAAGTVGGFVKNQVSAMTGFFDTLFAREVHTETLCIGDICVDEAGLETLLQDNDVAPVEVEVAELPVATEPEVVETEVVTQEVSDDESESVTVEEENETEEVIETVEEELVVDVAPQEVVEESVETETEPEVEEVEDTELEAEEEEVAEEVVETETAV